MKLFYVPMRLSSWGSFVVKDPVRGEVRLDFNGVPGVGYLHVFDSPEELLEVYPDVEYMEFRLKEDYDGCEVEE